MTRPGKDAGAFRRAARHLFLSLVVTGGLAVSISAVSAQSPAQWAELNGRINRLEAQLSNLRGSNARFSSQTRAPGSMPPAKGAEISLALSDIEAQMRRLTGQLEDMRFRLRRLTDRLKKFSQDVEFRFRDLEKNRSGAPPRRRIENGAGGTITVLEPPIAQPPPTRPSHTGRRPPGGKNGAGPQILTGPSLDGRNTQIPPLGRAPDNSSLKKAAPPMTLGRIPAWLLDPDGSTLAPDQPVIDEAGGLYERAYESYLKRRFSRAESSFKGFLRRYPKHELAGQAQYWLGETFYVRRKYRAAARAFLVGYRAFPKGRKAPETLLKLAMSLRRLGDKGQACATFDKLRREYPTASPAIKKTASAQRRRAGC